MDKEKANKVGLTVVPIASVKPNPNNPRIIKDDKFNKLVESVKSFPEMLSIRPIVVNSDMVVLGGNMRLRACKEAGLKEIPIIKASQLTLEQQREFIIKDNVSGGEWDWDMLANEWNAEELDAWGLDVPVFAGEGEGNFDDEGIEGKSQYGVIVMCENEGNQESVFKDLQGMGYECKVVVT
jgi:ParB-like chromosome segregation protein Spo0J